MRNPPPMSPRIYLPLHCGRTDRDRSSQLLLRHHTTRHILCSSPLPLRPLHRSRLRHYSRLRSLIPPIYGLYPSQHLIKNPLRCYILRRQPNILSPTLPRISRHAPTILGLPRRLHSMKHCLFTRLFNFINSRNHIPLHYLRSICCQARSTLRRTHSN